MSRITLYKVLDWYLKSYRIHIIQKQVHDIHQMSIQNTIKAQHSRKIGYETSTSSVFRPSCLYLYSTSSHLKYTTWVGWDIKSQWVLDYTLSPRGFTWFTILILISSALLSCAILQNKRKSKLISYSYITWNVISYIPNSYKT